MSGTQAPPYNEDQIVSLLTQVYNIYIDLAYVDASTIAFAPTNGRHTFPAEVTTLFDELNLSPAVTSLLSRIPFPHPETERPEIYPFETGFLSFEVANDVRMSRDPQSYCGEEIDYSYLSANEIVLTEMTEGNGVMLVLNVVDNTVKEFRYGSDLGPAQSAPLLLQSWIDDLRSLKYLPHRANSGDYYLTQGLSGEEPEEQKQLWLDSSEGQIYSELKRVLEDDYGWPTNFRKEDWARDANSIWREVEQRHDHA